LAKVQVSTDNLHCQKKHQNRCTEKYEGLHCKQNFNFVMRSTVGQHHIGVSN